MTDPTPPDPDDLEALTAEPDDLDGHTIDELAAYLDRGRDPIDPSIEGSESCRHALASLERLRGVSEALLTGAGAGSADDDTWLAGVMQRITLDSRAGRDIVVRETPEGDRVVLTEGALRSLVRSVGDEVPGFLVGRVRLDGDLSAVDDAVTITVEVVVTPRTVIPTGAQAIRRGLLQRLRHHTHLRDPRIDVVVRDVLIPRRPA